ncbi:MAG: tetratricopeptide repeat protein [Bryobacteraceae bacterium]
MRRVLIVLTCVAALAAASSELEKARDRQDRAALDKMAADANAAAAKAPSDAALQYRAALAYSTLAEVTQEQRDKGQTKRAAESGIRVAERAVSLKPDVAEYHRILGTLYGQIIPGNVLAGLGFGKKAQEAIGKAIEKDPKSAAAYISRGVGNYYLPQALGGGTELALRDFQKAIELDPKSDEAYLWKGLALRKLNRNADARKALQLSLSLNPDRIWTKQQLEKTPAN